MNQQHIADCAHGYAEQGVFLPKVDSRGQRHGDYLRQNVIYAAFFKIAQAINY